MHICTYVYIHHIHIYLDINASTETLQKLLNEPHQDMNTRVHQNVHRKWNSRISLHFTQNFEINAQVPQRFMNNAYYQKKLHLSSQLFYIRINFLILHSVNFFKYLCHVYLCLIKSWASLIFIFVFAGCWPVCIYSLNGKNRTVLYRKLYISIQIHPNIGKTSFKAWKQRTMCFRKRITKIP